MTTSLQSRPFGTLLAGEPVEAWTLKGAGGLIVEAITYGGIVTRLLAPGRDGKLEDVVLGFNRIEDYLAGHPYFGAIIGRVAGRTTGGAFHLEGKSYTLAVNDDPNHLHGGICGFDKKLWKATPVSRENGAPSLRLTASSLDGEEGYPGIVEVSVTYTVTANNSFIIETEANTDRPTPLVLTHHSYFNLAGEGSGAIRDHTLQIHADEFAAEDEHMTLLGRLEAVAGSAEDFREPRELSSAISSLFLRHGSMYRVPSGAERGGSMAAVARLVHAASGRVLDVSTTENYLQFYTGGYIQDRPDGSPLIGKSGSSYRPFAGICLECQGYPDAINAPHMDDIVLRPGVPRRNMTAYAFSVLTPTNPKENESSRSCSNIISPPILVQKW